MLETASPGLLQYRNSWTVLSVTDVSKALDFYRDQLGISFNLIIEDENGKVAYIGSPLNLHFTTGKPFLYMVVESIEELYEDYRNKGVNVIDELKLNPHTGMDEFAIQDDDGNIIRFGRDIPEE
jgi:catechol 2,3-dioxygenase-like lactoylglutathione lyase family enzyme